MKHLEEGLLLAIRDEMDVSDEARAHLDACASCAAALEGLHRRAESIELALTALDRPIEPTAAKVGVRARVRQYGVAKSSRRWGARHLGRAAALLLVASGAAAALPGSPLRDLLSLTSEEPSAVPPTGTVQAEEAPRPATQPTPSQAGIAVGLPEGSVQVVLRGAVPGTEVAVRWSEEALARVDAAAGSRFTYAAGRVEVDVARGVVQVELPRGANHVSVQVDGHVLLRGSPISPSISDLLVEETEESLRFVVEGS